MNYFYVTNRNQGASSKYVVFGDDENLVLLKPVLFMAFQKIIQLSISKMLPSYLRRRIKEPGLPVYIG